MSDVGEATGRAARRRAGLRADRRGQPRKGRPQRLHLLHPPGAGLGTHLPGHRQAPEWADGAAHATAQGRQPHIFGIFAEIEKWLADRTKYEAVDVLRTYEVPCAPVFSMKELAYDPDLCRSGTVVEVEQKQRGTYLTVGSPIKFTSFEPVITPTGSREGRVRVVPLRFG